MIAFGIGLFAFVTVTLNIPQVLDSLPAYR